MYRVYNLSHGDLDGQSSAVIIRSAHSGITEHVTTEFADYSNVSKMFLKALRCKNPYNRIIVTDICWLPPSGTEYHTNDDKMLAQQYLPRAIQSYLKQGGELILLDHHPLAMQVKRSYDKYLSDLSIVQVRDANGNPRAGSELAAEYHSNISGKPKFENDCIKAFGKLTGDYDVWRNPKGYGGTLAMASELANDHYGMMTAFEKGLHNMLETVNKDCAFTDENFEYFFNQTMIADYIQHAKELYEEQVQHALTSNIQHAPMLREIYASFFPSLVSEEVYDRFGGVVICRYNPDRSVPVKVSLRKHADINLDLGEIAKSWPQGGGHHDAAGIGRVKLPELIDRLVYELNLIHRVVR